MIDALQYEFMRNAVYAGLLASVACGIIGVYVVVNRMVSISGGIAHASFGGIGIGYFAGFSPVIGAMIFAIASAFGMGIVVSRTQLPEDAAIGVLWAVGMALGITFIEMTPGYTPDPMSYLFGNILTVPSSDLLLMLILDVIIVSIVIAFYKEFLVLSFDKEFGLIVGSPVQFLYLLLLGLIALTVVMVIKFVGIILVIALLTIPATIARQFTYDLRKMMLLSILLGAIFSFGGLWISYEFDLASGATIILLSSGILLATLGLSKLKFKKQTTSAAS